MSDYRDPNDPTWRKSSEGQKMMHITGDCDGGRAHSLWQIHPIVDHGSRLYEFCNIDVVGSGASRVGAAKCALAIARASMESTGTLCGYSGEPCFEGDHPKADLRLDFIRSAITKHPFRVLPRE